MDTRISPSKIAIAGTSIFSCCFFTIFSIKSLVHAPIETWQLMLFQALLCTICYLMDTKILIGLGIAPLLFFNNEIRTGSITDADIPFIFSSCGILLLVISQFDWIAFIKKYLVYQPGLATASCFCALLLLESSKLIQTLDHVDIYSPLLCLGILIMIHLLKYDFGPILVFLILLLATHEYQGLHLSYRLIDYSLPDITPTYLLRLVLSSLSLLVILIIDISTCMTVISKPLEIDTKEQVDAIRSTVGINSTLSGILGIGTAIVYFENLAGNFKLPGSRYIPLVSGLCFVVTSIILNAVSINVSQFALCFSLYLVYLILYNFLIDHGPYILITLLVALASFIFLKVSYVEAIALISVLVHMYGTARGYIKSEDFIRNFTFWALIFVLHLSFLTAI
tara:strand:- start:2761 stop:3945 length:1185 start_codon:yes stop_codon:yes gene_type:complete